MKQLKRENHSFALPDELGWQCNDEINAKFKEIFTQWSEGISKGDTILVPDILIAQLMDEMYIIVKKYLAGE